MDNLLTSEQMRMVDAYTIQHQPISSIDLMECAAQKFVKVFKEIFPDKSQSIGVYCGQGNNGGDGLAIARLLQEDKYQNISVYLINFATKESKDYTENLRRLSTTKIKPLVITHPALVDGIVAEVIIDAILGSGLNKPLTGKYAALAQEINGLKKTVVAVDVPTGFPSEGVIDKNYRGIKANLVISFQLPKLNFFFPESVLALDQYRVVKIGLDKTFIADQPSQWKLITKPCIRPRNQFTHKGTYGHALIVAGNTNTMGAALLCAQACLRTGAGLTTLCLPQSGLVALNSTLPEVMALPMDKGLSIGDFEKYTAFAIGPGMGSEEKAEQLLEQVIAGNQPIVIDADALSLLAKRNDLFDRLPEQTILTPHMKEFDRLFGVHQTWWERVETAQKQARARKLVIVLKNQYTFVCLSNGEVHVNETGNAGMASGGMGDVLTGMIVGFLAQSYASADAAKLAVYVHGKAGDELAKKRFTVSASQVAQQIPKTIKRIR